MTGLPAEGPISTVSMLTGMPLLQFDEFAQSLLLLVLLQTVVAADVSAHAKRMTLEHNKDVLLYLMEEAKN